MKKLWRDPVWSSVIAAGLIALATYLLDFWPLIFGLLSVSILVPVWVVFVAVPVLFLIIPFFNYIRSDGKPRFTKYTSDNIFDISWSWRWSPPGFQSSSYQPRDLTPRCPNCHALLTIKDYSGDLVVCVNDSCNWLWKQHHKTRFPSSSELYAKVHNEIDRKVHSREKGLK